jgi:uncharacterized LabA/DUF88 family protein
MALTIDAMDLLYTKRLAGIALVSSDSDFTPLVMRLRADGLKVFGFGEEKTPMASVNAYSRFLYLEKLEKEAPVESRVTPPTRKSAKELKSDTKLMTWLRNAVASAAAEDGWAHLGTVGSHISKQSSFDQRNYGYVRLSDLIATIDLFETDKRSQAIYVRDKRRRNIV